MVLIFVFFMDVHKAAINQFKAAPLCQITELSVSLCDLLSEVNSLNKSTIVMFKRAH